MVTTRVSFVFVLGFITFGQAKVSAQNGLAYVANSGSDNVSAYSINALSGALTEVTGSPFAAAREPLWVTVDPSGRFVYVPNFGADNVSAYKINASTGALSPITGSPFATGFEPRSMAINPLGTFAYVVNTASESISIFSIDPATGALVPSNTAIPTPNPFSIAFHPSGKYVYVTNFLNAGTVSGYSVDFSTGSLTPLAGSPFSAGAAPWGVTVDPSGKFAFVSNNVTNSSNVLVYTIDSDTGFLSLVGSSRTTGDPLGIAVTDKFLYVANNGGCCGVSAYSFDAITGALSEIPGSPFAAPLTPYLLVVDSLGRFLFVAGSPGGVSVYAIASSDGALAAVAGSPFMAGQSAASVAVILRAPTTIPVAIASAPVGLSFSATGTGCQPGSYPAPTTLNWATGAFCTVTFSTPQSSAPGTQYLFTAWTDGGITTNPRPIATPASTTTYTANFKTQYQLTTAPSPIGSGTVSGAGFYDSGSSAPITATPGAGFQFLNWTGPVALASSASTTVAISGPASVTANFQLMTTMTVAAASGQFNSTITLSATVGPSSPVFTGTLQFQVDGISIGSAVPVTGSGTYTTSYLIDKAAGNYPITATLTSTTATVAGSSGRNLVSVFRATPTITFATPAAITYGTALSSAQLNATGSVPGSFAYTPMAGTVLPSGNDQSLSVVFTPTDAAHYTTATATTTINVSKANASVTPNAASKTYAAADPAFTGTLSGFLPADNVTATYTRTIGESAGPYTISATLSPAAALGNYTITYNTAAFTILVATTTTIANVTGQYSDPVILSATISPPGVALSGTLQFQVDGVNAGPAILVSGGGVYTATYLIAKAAGAYTIAATLTPSAPGVTGSSGAGMLTVGKEDATITPAVTNPKTVKVNAPGGLGATAGPVTLTGIVAEPADGSPGDISKALVTVTLVPAVAGESNISCQVTNSGGSLTATCLSLPVEAYVVQWRMNDVNGNYYQGSADTLLAVYDPSLGFVTGGGSVIANGVSADFAFSVKYKNDGSLQGGLTYIEHRATGDVTVSTTALTSMSIVSNSSTSTTAVILGQVTVNRVLSYALQATLTDNGEPGIHNDLFGLKLTGGTLNSPIAFDPALITAGNIQMH